MVGITDVKSRARLRRAMEYSRKQLAPFRRHRMHALEQLVGKHYSDSGARDKVPINLLELLTTIYLQQLAGGTPQALITTAFKQFRPSASLLQMATNHTARQIHLRDTLQSVVQEALFSIGIVKQGINASSIEVGGEFHDPGQPFVDPIFLDDWVMDMTAKRWEQQEYRGNRWRAPLDEIMDSGLYDREAAEAAFKMSGDLQTLNEDGDDRAESLSVDSGGASADREYSKHVELWDLYLPREGVVVTLPFEGDGKPLRIVEWEGPESGPYKKLSFRDIPNNVMPLPTVANSIDLHDLANRLFNKLGRQAEREKTVAGVRGDATEDGKRLLDASDGEMITMDDPSNVNEVHTGGISPSSLAFTMQIRELFSYLGGNLDALGGLGAQSETAKQDELLTASASQRMQAMQLQTLDFTKDVLRDIAWWLFYDPLIELPMTKRVPGVPVDIPVQYSADQMEGTFLDYNFDIAPFSMQHQTPQAKLQQINQVFQTIIAPSMPFMQQQGITVSFEHLLRTFSQYGNLPELLDILEFADPQGMEPQPVGQQPTKAPAVTQRSYIRENRSTGGSRSGRDQAMINALMGIGQQDGQARRAGAMP